MTWENLREDVAREFEHLASHERVWKWFDMHGMTLVDPHAERHVRRRARAKACLAGLEADPAYARHRRLLKLVSYHMRKALKRTEQPCTECGRPVPLPARGRASTACKGACRRLRFYRTRADWKRRGAA